jgi:nitrogen fixation/metabolism regulation signal transduction histidine kinase
MAFDQRLEGDSSTGDFSALSSRRKRIPLGKSGRRLSFERRLRLSLYLAGLPAFALLVFLLQVEKADASIQWILLPFFALTWMFAVSLLTEQVLRPLQTLANVVAALREDDYSFRARGGRRNDAMGDLALEINALAGMLQAQRAGAMEAMALVERVMKSMQAPVLAFDPDGNLKLLNSAAERVFDLSSGGEVRGRPRGAGSRTPDKIARLLRSVDNDLLVLGNPQQPSRWVVKRSAFRLRGVPHSLFVLSDVSEALREEERLAWERLIRVLGHEINNSLTPIKSIAGSLRSRLASTRSQSEDSEDFARGLEVIEDRAESLNRFLQAYRELMGLPAPKRQTISISKLVQSAALLETRLPVKIEPREDVTLTVDPDQLSHALINLLRNAAEAVLSPEAAGKSGMKDETAPMVEMRWDSNPVEVTITILDNGLGLSNKANLFVPFYTTKPGGTGIGLVLAQQIAVAHGGSVRLSNRVDTRGCKAELTLPRFPSPRNHDGSYR